ncbi:MAG TPA: hypothetical protein VF463_19390 [Sphingobium sp.]
MKSFVIVRRDSAAGRRFLVENQLIKFQLFDLTFQASDHRTAFRFNDLVENLPDLLLNQRRLALDRNASLARLGFRLIPTLAENFREKVQQFRAWRQLGQHVLKRAFHRVALHRLAEAITAAMAADIIGIATVSALSPVRGHGMVAIATGDETAQREINMNVGTGRRESLASHTLLYLMEGSQRNDRLVMAGTK